MIKVASIDNYPLYQAGIVDGLSREDDISVVGVGSSIEDMPFIVPETLPDVILIAVTADPGHLKIVETILAQYRDIRSILLADIFDSDAVCRAMQGGVWGIVQRNTGSSDLVRAIRAVYRGERYVAPILAGRLFSAPAAPLNPPDIFASLTWREEKILDLLTEGLSNKEIGGRLLLSEKTVKHYLTIILDKLCVRNRVQAAIVALNRSNSSKLSVSP